MKKIITVLFVFAFLCLFPFTTHAFEEEDIEKLPPKEFENLFHDEEGTFQLPDLSFFLSFMRKEIFNILKQEKVHLSLFLAYLCISSIYVAFENTLRNHHLKGPLRLLFLLLSIFLFSDMIIHLFSVTYTHLQNVCSFLTVSLPLLSSLYISMGALQSAAISASALSLFLALTSEFSLGILFPLSKICYSFKLISAFHPKKGLFFLGNLLEKSFLWLLGLVSTVLLTAFAFQNVIASKADSLSLRAFRWTAGGLFPVVGSTLNESSKTLIAGLELLKSTLGGTVITVILLYMIPPLCTLLLIHFLLMLLSGFSKMFENDVFDSVCTIAASAIKSMIALLTLCDVCAIVAFAITVSGSVM